MKQTPILGDSQMATSKASKQIATTHKNSSLVSRMASRFGVDDTKLMATLKATAFKTPNDSEPTNEQMMALMVVSEQHGLNPFTKEIFAFPDKKNGIVPVVSVDGWARIINEHPEYDGCEFTYSDEVVQMDDDAKVCPEWCEIAMHRKDRGHPIVVREYLDEVYRPAFEGQGKSGPYKVKGPWQSHTKRMLRHKTLIQGARIAFGFSGIYDEDEATRIVDSTALHGEYTVVQRGKPDVQMPKSKEPESQVDPRAEDNDFQKEYEASETREPGEEG
jgi:phage recombination protein Bet